MHMRIFFAISACAWAYIVGRCIAFGPYLKSIFWKVQLTTTTWYRLTPILYKIPYTFMPYIPALFTLCKAYSLAIDDNTIHILGVLLLTSAHAFLPIFIIQIHSKYIITNWAILNIIGNIFYATLHSPIQAIPIYILIGIHTWLLFIELQLYKIPIIRHVPPYEERQPRAMTV